MNQRRLSTRARVAVRCGYSLAPGNGWWPSQVILDGVDITNVPTDFSAHENGRLEVLFTQHPARITGTVMDVDGQPVRAPWILFVSADRALWQEWATTTNVTQGNTTGQFSLAVLPGKYLVRAVPQATFDSYRPRGQQRDGIGVEARPAMIQLATEGVPVEVEARKGAMVTLTVKAP